MELTADQEAEARRIFETLKDTADAELWAVARLLAAKQMGEIFGRTEFEVRDHVHRIGAAALESALAGRKKGGTRVPASPAQTATGRPGSSATKPGES
jgi:hypothetical protein